MVNRTHPLIVMGFDYGSKHLGVAVGQTLTATANPLTTLEIKSHQPDWQQLTALVQEWHPNVLVVGLPSLADGSENSLIREIHQFKIELQQRLRLPVDFIDETLSTVAAIKYLSGSARLEQSSKSRRAMTSPSKARKKGESKDAVAAKIILETWLAECT
jgi:putative Holliday junction resolvase